MSPAPQYNLFVYGSLRSGFRSPAYEYISRFFTLVSEARVRGKLFDMGDFPAGVPTEENYFLTGELYRINKPEEFAWAIGQLDDYEGISREAGEKPLFRREITEVDAKGEKIQAWIYWYNGDTASHPLIASGDIMDYAQRKN